MYTEVICTYLYGGSAYRDPIWRIDRWEGQGSSRTRKHSETMSHQAMIKSIPIWELRGFKVNIPKYTLTTNQPRW